MRPKLVRLLGLGWCGICLLPGILFVAQESFRFQKFQTELLAVNSEIQAGELDLKNRLLDNALVTGAFALQQRQAEWSKRLAHDPRFARSRTETALLEMERLGRDPGLAAQQALEKAARLGSPRGSRIEVKPLKDGFHVRVAFPMSALSQNESGTVTKHHNTETMREEIHRLSAQVIKDLYDTCGSRGIELLSVSCNHGISRSFIPKNATPLEQEEFRKRGKIVMASIYRVSMDRSAVAKVTDWRALPSRKITQLMKVENDGLVDLQIRSDLPGSRTTDPKTELEF